MRISQEQGCNLWRNWVRLPPFCSQPVAALAGCQQRPERWRTEVLDFCTGSHKSSSFTRRKSRTSNNPVPVLRIPSKYGWMSCSLNESNLTRLRHKLQPCSGDYLLIWYRLFYLPKFRNRAIRKICYAFLYQLLFMNNGSGLKPLIHT